MTTSLKKQTFSGMIWSFIQRSGTMIISFITTMVLARLLSPDDFGIIGMLLVFTSLADTLVNGGFHSALIQKKHPTDEDYSTVFYWNLIVSIILYLLLFFGAPLIARYYNMPLLIKVLRVQGISVIINSLMIIQNNQLIKKLEFKKLASINIISSLIGSGTGIIMALLGFGVWSLVAKMIVMSLSSCIILWVTTSWYPGFVFSVKSFKELFNFGFLMLLSYFTETLVYHIQSLVIGRVYTAKDLGYYTQARNLNDIPSMIFPQVVDQVMFPVYSSLQDDKIKVVDTLKKSLKGLAYVNFPLMLLLAVIAEPLFIFLFSDKWLPSVPYFQILCFGGMCFTINSNNTNVIRSLGKSNYILISTLINRSITLIFIFIGLQYGIKGVAIGYSLSLYCWIIVNMYLTSRITIYKIKDQIKDLLFNYIIAFVVALIVFIISKHITNMHYFLKMLILITIFSGVYLFLTKIFKIEGYNLFLELLKTMPKKIKFK